MVLKTIRAASRTWSPDSNWLAFSVYSGPRVSDTYVYRRSDTSFAELKTDNLEVDVRNQYVTPVRWLKPGVLLLEQVVIFRGGDPQAGRKTCPLIVPSIALT